MKLPLSFCLQDRITTGKRNRLVERADKTHAAFQRRILIGDVMSVMHKLLFHAATVERVHAGKLKAMAFALFPQHVKTMARLIDRHIKLPAQFTDVGYARRPGT